MKIQPQVYFSGLVLLSLLTAWLYFPITQFEEYLNWDDYVYLLQENVQELSWENIKKYFYTDVNKTYVPLTMLSWILESSIWEQAPHIHLRVNLGLYLFSLWLVAWVTRLLFKRNDLSLLSTAIFALHPAHVESVAWITERKDLLYGFFFLLGLGFYILHARTKNSGKHWYFLALLTFILALFSKGQAVTFPLLIIAVDYLHKRASFSFNYILGRAPFFLLSLLFGWLALHFQSLLNPQELAGEAVYSFTITERLILALSAFARYVQITLFPVWLNPIVPLPHAGQTFSTWFYFTAFLAPVLAIAFFIWGRRNKIAGFGYYAFTVTLVLMLDHSSVGNVHIADRFLYIPLLGAAITLSALALQYYEKSPKICAGVVFTYLAFCGFKTKQQVYVWQDEESLYRYALKLKPENPVALSGYGGLKLNYFQADSALFFFQKSDSLLPEQADVILNMGKALFLLERYEESIPRLQMGLSEIGFEEKPEEHYLLARAYFITGRSWKSLSHINEVLAVNPPQAQFLVLRGSIYLRYFNDLVSSKADFDMAVRLNPSSVDAWNGLAVIAAMEEEYEPAILFLENSLKINPYNCDTYQNLSMVLELSGDETGSLEIREKALEKGCP